MRFFVDLQRNHKVYHKIEFHFQLQRSFLEALHVQIQYNGPGLVPF